MALKDLQRSDGQLTRILLNGTSGTRIVGPFEVPLWQDGGGPWRALQTVLVSLSSAGRITAKMTIQQATEHSDTAAEANRLYHDVGDVDLTESGSLQIVGLAGRYFRVVIVFSQSLNREARVSIRAV